MVNPFICGSGSISHQLEKEYEDDYSQSSTPSKLTPKKSKKGSLSRSRDDKNPFAKRGLDKFSSLLAEIEDKKKKIYTHVPSDDISFVCFTYSDTDTIKPIVVRSSDKKQEIKIKHGEKEKSNAVVDSKEASAKHHFKSSTPISEPKQGITNIIKNSFPYKPKIDLRKPSFYLPLTVILVMVILAFFGRSFAILCTSIGWYLLPTINKGNSCSKRKNKKKEYTTRVSDKNITVNNWLSSPRTVLTADPVNYDVSHRKGCRRKSW